MLIHLRENQTPKYLLSLARTNHHHQAHLDGDICPEQENPVVLTLNASDDKLPVGYTLFYEIWAECNNVTGLHYLYRIVDLIFFCECIHG